MRLNSISHLRHKCAAILDTNVAPGLKCSPSCSDRKIQFSAGTIRSMGEFGLGCWINNGH
jgi:hypothetical protein